MIFFIKNKIVNLQYYIKAYLLKKYKFIGYEYINKAISDNEYESLCKRLYGNQYLERLYGSQTDQQLQVKRWLVNVIKSVLPDVKTVCDAGANRGYLMQVFRESNIESYGFDILDNKDSVVQEVHEFYKIGSILDIPSFDVKFDLVTSIDVFEHIPINKTDQMVYQLKKLSPKYFVLQISKDMLNDGHITLKGTDFWVQKFLPEYRLMTEIYDDLSKYRTVDGKLYKNTGIPRNDYNKSPGILFLKKMRSY